ncbi:MAG: hypothetical protein AB7S75_04195 [Desulfococcaceae bacterium]
MKFFPFKILILAVLLPPVLYIFSVEIIQKLYIDNWLEDKCRAAAESIAIGNPQPLFNGDVRLKDRIRGNISDYLKGSILTKLGIKVRIAVLTKKGTVLYPPYFETDEDFLAQHNMDPMRIAAENLKLMEEGLLYDTELVLGYTSLLSILVLIFYVSAASCFLSYFYKKGSRKTFEETVGKNREIGRLAELEKQHSEKLRALEKERSVLTAEFGRLRKTLEEEKARASRNEDEMVKEIIALEEKIQNNLALRDEQQSEIRELQEKLSLLEKDREKEEPARKEVNIVQKRLKTLYKNISFEKKAVNGFAALEEDLKIKCEELIHLLNDEPELVTIKRKVFGKKGRQTVLEVVFAYKGRLYFRKTKDNRIEILTIGTKNSQTKDLEYLNSL